MGRRRRPLQDRSASGPPAVRAPPWRRPARPRHRPRLRQRSRGPARRAQGPGHDRHPVPRLLGLEGDHRDGRPPLPGEGRARHQGSRLRLHPRSTPSTARATPRSATSSPTAPASPALPRGGARRRADQRPRVHHQFDLRLQAVRDPGHDARLSRRLGRIHPRRGRHSRHRPLDPRHPGRGDPPPAVLPLGQLGRGRGGPRQGRARLRHRREAVPAPDNRGQARAQHARRGAGRSWPATPAFSPR